MKKVVHVLLKTRNFWRGGVVMVMLASEDERRGRQHREAGAMMVEMSDTRLAY